VTAVVFRFAVIFHEVVTGDPDTEKSVDVNQTDVTVPVPVQETNSRPVSHAFTAATLPACHA
jgi:hypothetical protein